MSIKQTKNVLVSIIALLIVLIFIQACEKTSSTSLIGTLSISENETKTVSHQGKNITIKATDFKESRCPINANCIWQGYASVKITFKDDVKEQELILCTSGCSVANIPIVDKVTLNGTTYKLKLENITPYPVLNQPSQEPKKVKVTVSE